MWKDNYKPWQIGYLVGHGLLKRYAFCSRDEKKCVIETDKSIKGMMGMRTKEDRLNKLKGEYWHKARQLRDVKVKSREQQAQLVLYDEFYSRLNEILKPR